ncbi:OprO/OprP family phosphate-selective porin [bacterium]|jgi:phosphate-selective porin OprO and OprP|nr:ATPase [Planctomicrobium sp.]MDA7503904.1 OprO/OprP family phosphate-selective porin [bacterium]
MRLFKSKTLAALAIAAGLSVGGNLFADEQLKLDPQVQALIERLEAAEKQIQTLSSELNKVKSKQESARPFPNKASSPGAFPVVEGMLPIGVDGVFSGQSRVMNLDQDFSGSVVAPSQVPSIGKEEMAAFQQAISSNNSDLSERLEDLEDHWEELDRDWDKFNASEKKQKSDAAKKPTFSIGGRIHADYWDFVNSSEGIGFFENPDATEPDFGNSPEDRALFRRIRLEMKGDILETMLYRVQIDFNNPSSAEMKDVYIGFDELPNNQRLLIGHQKRPIGLDHLNSSRYNVFLERPFVVEAFNEDARRLGAAMHGYTDDESMNWSYGAYFLENLSRDGRYIGNSNQMSLNARVAGSPWYDESSGGRGYFHYGLSGMVARPDGDADGTDENTNNNDGRFRTRAGNRSNQRWLNTGRIAGAENYEILGLEGIFNVGPFQAVSEFQHTWLQRDGGDDVQFNGAYFYLSYFLTGEHIPYSRTSGTIGRVKPYENFFLVDNCFGGTSSGWGAWNVALRYDYLDLSDDDVLGGVGTAWTTALNWHWTPYSKVQFDASYGEIRDHEAVGGFTGGNYFLFGTRFAVEF